MVFFAKEGTESKELKILELKQTGPFPKFLNFVVNLFFGKKQQYRTFLGQNFFWYQKIQKLKFWLRKSTLTEKILTQVQVV